MSWWPFRRRPSREHRLDAELRYHVERQYDDYLREGLTPSEARRRVGAEFGPLELAKDECREVRPRFWIETTARDVRLGLRALARERLFTLSVTLILTAGIGATVAMFSVLNGVVLRPLPYARPHELAVIATHRMLQNQFDGTSGANFVDWRRESRTFDRMALYRRISASQVVFAGADAPQRAQEGLVDTEFFAMLGVPALAGRTFSAEESARGERVVVLSEGLWREQFAGSRRRHRAHAGRRWRAAHDCRRHAAVISVADTRDPVVAPARVDAAMARATRGPRRRSIRGPRPVACRRPHRRGAGGDVARRAPVARSARRQPGSRRPRHAAVRSGRRSADEPRPVARFRRGDLAPRDRVRERRRTAGRARDPAAWRAGHPRRARRQPRPAGPSARRREPHALARREHRRTPGRGGSAATAHRLRPGRAAPAREHRPGRDRGRHRLSRRAHRRDDRRHRSGADRLARRRPGRVSHARRRVVTAAPATGARHRANRRRDDAGDHRGAAGAELPPGSA